MSLIRRSHPLQTGNADRWPTLASVFLGHHLSPSTNHAPRASSRLLATSSDVTTSMGKPPPPYQLVSGDRYNLTLGCIAAFILAAAKDQTGFHPFIKWSMNVRAHHPAPFHFFVWRY